MSGEADGLLLLPFALAAVPLVGMVLVGGAAVAGIGAAMNAAARYEQGKRRKREEIRRSGINESIGSFRSDIAANMREQTRLNVQASEQMMRELENSRRAAISMAETNDPEKYQRYMGQVRASRQELSNKLFAIQDGYVKKYHVKISESMDKVTRTVNDRYESCLGELKLLVGNMQAKQEKARQLADEYIEEAKVILVSLEMDYEGSKFAGPQLGELKRQLGDAIGQYNLQNYEAALATAKDVSLSTVEEIYKADCKRQEWDNYYKLALTISSELQAYMEAQSVVTDKVKAEVEGKLGKPLEEEIVGVKISDYTDRTKDGESEYDSLMKNVTQVKELLESADAEKLTTGQLKGYVDLLNGKLYPSAALAIYKGVLNMSNAFSRQNVSEELIDFFEEHNFSFKGYSYDDDRHDGALHIGLENESTGEEIIVTLAPELMGNGEVQTRVEIDQLMGDEANEERKAFYRSSIENVVTDSTPGAQIKLECKKEYRNRLSDRTGLRDRLRA